MGKYVIAVQRTANYSGKIIPPEQRGWYYAQYDGKNNYPTFYDLRGALMFNTPQQAESWYETHKDLFVQTSYYDLNTFQIQEISARTVKGLKYEKPTYDISLLWGDRII